MKFSKSTTKTLKMSSNIFFELPRIMGVLYYEEKKNVSIEEYPT